MAAHPRRQLVSDNIGHNLAVGAFYRRGSTYGRRNRRLKILRKLKIYIFRNYKDIYIGKQLDRFDMDHDGKAIIAYLAE